MADTINKAQGEDIGIAENLEKLSGKSSVGRWKKMMFWLLPVALVVIGWTLWSMHGETTAVRYKTEAVRKGDVTVTVSATGNLQPTNKVEIGSELSGIVKSVDVDYNDQVKVGQVLARLDPRKFEAQVLQSKAALAAAQAKELQAKATVAETRAALERLEEVRKLSNNRAASKSDLDAAIAARDRAVADQASAKASVAQAEATLSLNQTDLAKTEIHSPINGIVLSRSVEPGQTVAASLQAPVLFTLAEDLTQMELHVDVDEADVGQVKVDQPAVFTVDAYPERSFPARITQVRYGSTTTEGVVTYETILKVDNSDLSLRPGMTATATITVQQAKDVLVVPNAALRFAPDKQSAAARSGGGSILSKLFPRPSHRRQEKRREETPDSRKRQHVYVLVNGRPVVVPITIGLTDGTVSQVIKGNLQAGQPLVIDMESVSQ